MTTKGLYYLQRVLESLEKNEKDESQSRASDSTVKPRGYSWWSWRRSTSDAKQWVTLCYTLDKCPIDIWREKTRAFILRDYIRTLTSSSYIITKKIIHYGITFIAFSYDPKLKIPRKVKCCLSFPGNNIKHNFLHALMPSAYFSTESSPPKDDVMPKETVAQIEMTTETKTVTITLDGKQNSVDEKTDEVRELDIVEEMDPREFLEDGPQSLPQIIETQDQGNFCIHSTCFLKLTFLCYILSLWFYLFTVDRHDHSSSDSDQDGQIKRHGRRHSSFRKTLRLSSEQIVSSLYKPKKKT